MGRGMPGRKEGFPGCEQRERDGNAASFGGNEPPEQMSSQAVGNPRQKLLHTQGWLAAMRTQEPAVSFAVLNTKTLEKKSDLRAVRLLSCGKVSRLKIIFFGLVKELSAMKTKYGTGIPCIYCLVRNNWLFLVLLL